MSGAGIAPIVQQFNLAAVSEAICAAAGDRVAIADGRRRLTYGEFAIRSRKLARVIQARGMSEAGAGSAFDESGQELVAILAYNGSEYLESMVGAFKARTIPININYRYVAEELRHVLGIGSVTTILYQSTFAPTLHDLLADLPRVKLLLQIADDSENQLLPGAQWYESALAGESGEPLEIAGGWSPDDHYVLMTGGTTGLPKAVLWRQADIFMAALGGRDSTTGKPWRSIGELVASVLESGLAPVVLPSSPFMHGAGHWAAFQALNQGGTVVIQDQVTRLNPSDICSTVEREGVNYLQLVGDAFGVPIVTEMETQRYDLSSLTTIRSGGSGLSMDVRRRFLKCLPAVTLIDALGSSEAGGQGTQQTKSGELTSSGSFTPVVGSVVVSSKRDRELMPGDPEIGWLAKRGDIALGYLNDPLRTAETFPMIGGERMVVPGDRARWLGSGQIELLGRDSAVINSGGEKIFAEEVEAAVMCHPAVEDVIVSSRPSPRWGQEVVAIVSSRESLLPSLEELKEEAGRHIARFKLPKAWLFVDEINRTPAGKADRRWASEMAKTAPD